MNIRWTDSLDGIDWEALKELYRIAPLGIKDIKRYGPTKLRRFQVGAKAGRSPCPKCLHILLVEVVVAAVANLVAVVLPIRLPLVAHLGLPANHEG